MLTCGTETGSRDAEIASTLGFNRPVPLFRMQTLRRLLKVKARQLLFPMQAVRHSPKVKFISQGLMSSPSKSMLSYGWKSTLTAGAAGAGVGIGGGAALARAAIN